MESDEASVIWRRSFSEGRGAVKNQAVLEWPEGESIERRSSCLILSVKRFPLSLTLLKKSISPIRKFAHKDIRGSSIDLTFSFILVARIQGRRNSAVKRSPSPCSAWNRYGLCRKNFFYMWIWGVYILSLSDLLSKVCPVTQDAHWQPPDKLFLLSVFASSFPKNGNEYISIFTKYCDSSGWTVH